MIPRPLQIAALAAAVIGFYLAFSGAYGGYARGYLPTAIARGAANALVWYLIVVGLYLVIRFLSRHRW